MHEAEPDSGPWIMVRVLPCAMPPGPRATYRDTDKESEQYTVVACRLNSDGQWVWLHLSSQTKEALGDLIFDHGLDRDRWWHALIEYSPTKIRPKNKGPIL